MQPVNQLTSGGAFPHEDCGEACVDSVKIDAGHADSVRCEERFDAALGDDPRDGTGGGVHVASLAVIGIPAGEHGGDSGAVITAGQGRGLNRWLLAIWSNSWGDPLPASGIGHWVLTDGVSVMNPIGGRILGGSYLQRCLAAQQQYCVQVDVRIAAGATPTPVIQGQRVQYSGDGAVMPNPGEIWCQRSADEWKAGGAPLYYRTRNAQESPLGKPEFENEIEDILDIPQGSLRMINQSLDPARGGNPFPPPHSDVYVGSARLGVGH
ncbi:MAG TPA: hypothetical protein VIX82_04495 [Solirubrobacteraceae bacterium]